MSSNFRKTTSNIFLSAFVALILVSFMFTGNEFLMSSPNEVANVGGQSVKFTEYENEMKRQMEFYKQFMGGKELTQKQIEQYNLKKNAINNIVARKLMELVAMDIGAEPSLAEVKKDIKSQPYFQTNEQFDINRYKAILARVGVSPEEFENETKSRLRMQIARDVINNLPVSKTYMEEQEKIRNQKRTIQYYSYEKDALKKHLPVSKQEIDKYLAEEANLNNIKAIFEARKSSFSQPEQVEASHILLRADASNEAIVKQEIEKISKEVTAKNFAEMANKYTQDSNVDPQTEKKKGGFLGWFGKGRMVPEFEQVAFSTPKGQVSKPVKTQFGYHIIYISDKKAAVEAKFDDYKFSLAKAELINTKLNQIDKLSDEIIRNIKKSLEENSTRTLEAVAKKFEVKSLKNEPINRLDGLKEENKIENQEFQQLFEQPVGKVHVFNSPNKVTIIKVEEFKPTPKVVVKKEGEQAEEDKELTPEQRREELINILTRKFSQNIINNKRDNISVKVYENRI